MRTDLLWRAAPAVAALLALLVGAPRPVSGGLALAALVLAGERLVRLRTHVGSHGALDRVLVLTGGLLVALVLTGMVLGATDIGLRPTTWVVALVVVSLAGLALAARAPRPATAAGDDVRRHTAVALKALPWVAAVVVVAAVSVGISSRSLTAVDSEPLEMSFGQVSGTEVEVVVSSSAAVGPLELRASEDGNDLSYPLISLTDDGTETTTLSLPRTGRVVITLNNPNQTQPLRTLVLDR